MFEVPWLATQDRWPAVIGDRITLDCPNMPAGAGVFSHAPLHDLTDCGVKAIGEQLGWQQILQAHRLQKNRCVCFIAMRLTVLWTPSC